MGSFNYIVFCVLVTVASVNAIGRVSYGEECNKDIRCDSRNFLACSNGTCSCLMPDTMLFENSTEKCVSLAGERCQYTTQEEDKIWTDEVPCISSAACQQGICECEANYYEISNGTCQEKHKYGETCISDEMCSSSKFQICGSEKTCICQPYGIYDDQSKVCLLKVNTQCLSEDTCVKNAICTNDYPQYQQYMFMICVCPKGYYETENGTCEEKRDLEHFCTENKHCKNFRMVNGVELPSFMVCINEKCSCDPIYSAEDTKGEGKYCGKLLGLPCVNGECFSGAECSGTCQCQSSLYYETEIKKCEPRRKHRSLCFNTRECLSYLVCNPITYTCDCENGKGYHADLGRCATSPEISCGTRGNFHGCVPNAKCEGDWYSKKCVCNPGFSSGKTVRKYCYIRENERCYGDEENILETITTKTCLPGLVCRNNTCSCGRKDHQVFNADHEKCYSLVDGPCYVDTDCDDKNAECILDNGVKQCRCKLGFTQAGRECDIAYMERCSLKQDKPRCDRFGPLECNNLGYCSCSDFQVYNASTKKCRGLVGAKCNVKEDKEAIELGSKFCVDGAICRGFRGFENVVGICVCKSGMVAHVDRTCMNVEALLSTTETLGNSSGNSTGSEMSYMADGFNDL